jgi:hypothetical protein
MSEGQIKVEDLISTRIDFLNITISKESIINNDFTEPMNILRQLTSSKSVIEYFRERVDISFDGYNNTREELYEIPEIRNYVSELDNLFPYWLYFLSKNSSGLLVIIKCFLLPFLKPDAEQEINGKKLQDYLEQRGFLAMNHLCELTNISEQEKIEMTNRLVNYLSKNQSTCR